MPKRKRGGKKKQLQPAPEESSASENESENEEQHQVFEDDDESIDDDEAFNSEDERKYGAFFDKDDDDDVEDDSESEGDSDDDDDADEDDSDDDDEGDGGQYMLDLLNKLDSPNNNDNHKNQEHDTTKAKAAAANLVAENEYAASVVPKGKLTLDSLMAGLDDTQGFRQLQKSVASLAKGETTATPVAKVVSKRAERQVHYAHHSKDVTRWLPTVQQNRQAETLDFRPKQHHQLKVTKESLVDKFVPTTDFEKAVQKALEEAGAQDEEAILKQEEQAFMNDDDLGGNELTLEEFQKRRGELAKLRALMFYHEQKRHRINKIKSKKYRRIRKKQRERAKEAELEAEALDNPDLLREMEEKEELARMKERMTLAHKNTSKWAKRILKRGKNVDADTRRALSAQLKRGDDLRQKMKYANGDDSDEDSDGNQEDLMESARQVLQETEVAEDDNDGQQPKGLFKLKFMQKGLEKQREQAKEEARQLLRELEANEKLDDYDDAVMDDDEDDEEEMVSKKKQIASKESMEQVLAEGEMVASTLKFGKSNAVTTSGGIDINLGFDTGNDAGSNEIVGTVSQHTATMEVRAEKDDDFDDGKRDSEDNEENHATEVTIQTLKTKKRKQQNKKIEMKANEDAEEANPWITSAATSSVTSSKKKSQKTSAMKSGIVDVGKVLDELADKQKEERSSDKDQNNANNKEGAKSIAKLSQEELVRKAFANSNEQEAEEEFAQEKQDVIDEENDVKTDKQRKKERDMAVVSGWGSWTGAGAPPPKPPKKLPKHLQPPKSKQPKRKRQDSTHRNLIIREKRVKKTSNGYMLDEIPYPFKSREEYERSMRGALGKEWNVSMSVKDMTRPEIQTAAGKIIQPLSMKTKKPPRRGPAKF